MGHDGEQVAALREEVAGLKESLCRLADLACELADLAAAECATTIKALTATWPAADKAYVAQALLDKGTINPAEFDWICNR